MDHSRNIGILSAEEQARLGSLRIGVIGVGLGSLVAELALRTGFRDIVIVDADTVSPSNLNRQSFVAADVGASKARACAARLHAIDPGARIQAFDEYVGAHNSSSLLGDRDLLVDTMDLSSIDAILHVHSWARTQGLPIVFPMNLIWTSLVTVFDDESGTLEELLGTDERLRADVGARDFGFWAAFLSRHVNEEDRPGFEAFVARASRMKDWCPAPQLGITAQATAALSVSVLVRLALGRPVTRAPKVASLDLSGRLR